MLPLIYTNAEAAIIFLIACLIWTAPEAVGMLKQVAMVSRTEAVVHDHGSMGILIGLQWFGLALNFALAWALQKADISWHRVVLFALGVALIILGVALRWYAVWTLGRYFTRDVAVSSDQHVIQHGPYRALRHPAYSGTFLTMLGVGLAVTNWASLLALGLCVLLGHMYRVRVEEKALIQTIGQPYVEYMQHTKRFIPWVY